MQKYEYIHNLFGIQISNSIIFHLNAPTLASEDYLAILYMNAKIRIGFSGNQKFNYMRAKQIHQKQTFDFALSQVACTKNFTFKITLAIPY